MARRPESQATTPVEIDLGFGVPQHINDDEPFLRPTDDDLDSPNPTLGVIDLPESDSGYSERNGFLPVEPVCVSTGDPPENLRRVSLPPMAKPLVSDSTAELSPVLLDIQLPDVKLPHTTVARSETPDPSETTRSDLTGTGTVGARCAE